MVLYTKTTTTMTGVGCVLSMSYVSVQLYTHRGYGEHIKLEGHTPELVTSHQLQHCCLCTAFVHLKNKCTAKTIEFHPLCKLLFQILLFNVAY